MSTLSRMRMVIRERGGFFALYRGIAPGTIRSFISNGSSMVVMSWAQRKVTELGLRGNWCPLHPCQFIWNLIPVNIPWCARNGIGPMLLAWDRCQSDPGILWHKLYGMFTRIDRM